MMPKGVALSITFPTSLYLWNSGFNDSCCLFFTLCPARPPTRSHKRIWGQDLERKLTPWAWKAGFSSGLACCSEQLWSLESALRHTAHSVTFRGRAHSKPLLTRHGPGIQTDISLSWQVCAVLSRSRADCRTGCASDLTTVCQQHQLPNRKQRVTSGPICVSA